MQLPQGLSLSHKHRGPDTEGVCVFITAVPITKLFARKVLG
jgi:hypothetical protein